ncbi:hypothetical protein N898_20545 [Salmonella enterica subsp. arizonae serovar 62:z36:- str. RKS2983]|nr:hypothetical protein N898_20545 [Salmonella enterica subsp. arizonae serovar 62:z36:- str. RKS2983]
MARQIWQSLSVALRDKKGRIRCFSVLSGQD